VEVKVFHLPPTLLSPLGLQPSSNHYSITENILKKMPRTVDTFFSLGFGSELGLILKNPLIILSLWHVQGARTLKKKEVVEHR